MYGDAIQPSLNPLGEPVRAPYRAIPADIRCAADYERHALHHVEAAVWRHIQGGADQDLVLKWNREQFDVWRLCPQPFVDLRHANTRVDLFGRTVQAPILLAPVAYHKLVHVEGELATTRAAVALQIPMVASTLSSYTMEEIADAAAAASGELGHEAPRWFQLYFQPDRADTLRLIRRAEASGHEAFVWTIDAAIKRGGFVLPPGVEAANLRDAVRTPNGGGGLTGPILFGTPLALQAPGWDDLRWLRAQTRLPILVKGVLSPDVAQRAVRFGADGIIVSNHGGRVLDSVVTPLEMLPEIVGAVGPDVPVLLDGGVRWGTDIVKSLALGARAVLIGRPQLHALAVAGMLGVAHLLHILRGELELAMAQLGCATVSDIGPHLLRSPPPHAAGR